MRAYNDDYAACAEDTAAAVRDGRWNETGREALADEVADLGKSERREIESALRVIFASHAQSEISARKACPELESFHRGAPHPHTRCPRGEPERTAAFAATRRTRLSHGPTPRRRDRLRPRDLPRIVPGHVAGDHKWLTRKNSLFAANGHMNRLVSHTLP
jgi:Domain of unknown function DUF29